MSMGVTLRQCDSSEEGLLMVFTGCFEPCNGVVLSSEYILTVALNRGPAVLMRELICLL